jgi:hypothetical protein
VPVGKQDNGVVARPYRGLFWPNEEGRRLRRGSGNRAGAVRGACEQHTATALPFKSARKTTRANARPM